MEEIWKYIMKNQADIQFEQPEYFSPYLEFDSEYEKKHLKINAFYRYQDIFSQFYEKNRLSEKEQSFLFDCIMHFLVDFEIRSGINPTEVSIRQRQRMLEQGEYGENVRKNFLELDDDLKYKVSAFLVRQDNTGESVYLFGKVLMEMLRGGILYKNEINRNELILYLGRKRKSADNAVISVVQELFLPFTYSLRIYYQTPFGVIGNDYCMEIGRFELY